MGPVRPSDPFCLPVLLPSASYLDPAATCDLLAFWFALILCCRCRLHTRAGRMACKMG